MTQKVNIRSLSTAALSDYLTAACQPAFRLSQLESQLWQKCAASFSDMYTLPESLRQRLDSDFYIDTLAIEQRVTGKDKTTKLLLQSIDNQLFECVLIPSNDRFTACFSTQVGCKLGCRFCATGAMGFRRDLSTGEIYEEAFRLNALCGTLFGKNISNIVIMGMGEPLLNYDNTLAAVDRICSKQGMAMSPQRITLSTSGIAPRIKQLADDNPKIALAVSLHSADNDKRSQLMPVNRMYNLDVLKQALIHYHHKTEQRITYEYVLLNNVNDSLADAAKLTEFTKITPCKVNVIDFNPTENCKFQKSSLANTQKFIDYVKNKNIVVTYRKSKGYDINAACGQLANKKKLS